MYESSVRPETIGQAAPASLRVLFFGKVADRFGHSMPVKIPAQRCSVSQLKVRLGSLVDGGAAALAETGVRWAIDHEIAGGEAWVRPGQDVAFLSAFSGG